MTIINHLNNYFNKVDCTHIAIVCEVNAGELVAIVAPKEELTPILAESVALDKKAESTGGMMQYRGKAGKFRRVLSLWYPDFRKIPNSEIVDFGNTSDFLTEYEGWRDGRNRKAWNLGNFAEYKLALYYGDTAHAERNTERGYDILTPDGKRIECKGLFASCSFQIPIVE